MDQERDPRTEPSKNGGGDDPSPPDDLEYELELRLQSSSRGKQESFTFEPPPFMEKEGAKKEEQVPVDEEKDLAEQEQQEEEVLPEQPPSQEAEKKEPEGVQSPPNNEQQQQPQDPQQQPQDPQDPAREKLLAMEKKREELQRKQKQIFEDLAEQMRLSELRKSSLFKSEKKQASVNKGAIESLMKAKEEQLRALLASKAKGALNSQDEHRPKHTDSEIDPNQEGDYSDGGGEFLDGADVGDEPLEDSTTFHREISSIEASQIFETTEIVNRDLDLRALVNLVQEKRGSLGSLEEKPSLEFPFED